MDKNIANKAAAPSTPTDSGVSLIIELVDTMPDATRVAGQGDALPVNSTLPRIRAFPRDHAALLTQSILLLIHATPIEDRSEFLENLLRDEIFNIEWRIAGEREIY